MNTCNILEFVPQIHIDWQPIVDAPRRAIDYATRIVKDADALNNLTKFVSTALEIINRHVEPSIFKEIGETCRSASDLISARSFVGGIQELVSGDAAWKKPISATMPNVIRVASRAFLLISNLARTVGWLMKEGFINAAAVAPVVQGFLSNIGIGALADMASQVGILPLFGFMGDMTLGAIKDQAGIIGFAIDLVDIARQVGVNGFSTDTWIMIASDVGKIGAIVLAGSAVPTWAMVGLVAAATASAVYLIKHFRTEYKL